MHSVYLLFIYSKESSRFPKEHCVFFNRRPVVPFSGSGNESDLSEPGLYPIVTIGPALTALYYMTLKLQKIELPRFVPSVQTGAVLA